MSGFPFTDHRTVAETEDRTCLRYAKPKRPIPSDFAKHAAQKNIYQLVKHYRTSDKAIKRWIAESGIVPPSGLAGRPVPDNFAELCTSHTMVELIAMHKADRKVVQRWCNETGVQPQPCIRKGRTRSDARFQHRPKAGTKLGVMGGGGLKLTHDNRPKSIWDEAADILRAERWIVYRSNERGQADPKGRYWRMGQLVLEPDDLLRRADRYRKAVA